MTVRADTHDVETDRGRLNELGPLGEPPVSDFLRILQREIRDNILGDPSSAESRTLLEMSVGLLDYLVARESAADAATRGIPIDAALGKAHGNNAATALEKHLGEASGREQLGTLIRAIAAPELEFLKNIRSEVTPTASAEAPIAARFQTYLRAREGYRDAEVTEMRKLVGGYSKDVFLCRFRRDGLDEALVVRRDSANGPLETSALDEFPVLKAAEANGVPVASPLWVERSADALGKPFMVSAFVQGVPGSDFQRNFVGGDPKAVYLQLAAVLAQVHAIDPIEAAVTPAALDGPMADHILRLIDYYEAQWRRRRGAIAPILSLAIAWMRKNVPAGGGTARIIHGDPTPRNLLLNGDKVEALLDWETWHVGDPAEDLAYVREEMPSEVPWKTFYDAYLAHGGVPVPEERLLYWEHWKYLFGTISSVTMMSGIVDSDEADLRTAFGAVFFTKYCMSRVGEQLLAAPDGVTK